MRNRASSISFTLLLLFSSPIVMSTALASPQSSSANDLIDQTCNNTPFFDLCSRILHSNPVPPSNPNDMALIMIKNIEENATDTLNYIQELIKRTSDHQLERQLSLCAEDYIPIVKYDLPQAVDALNRRNFPFASYSINYAGKEVDDCNKKFSGSQSPVADRNEIMRRLVGVTVAIIKLLHVM
ncbi:hypothetical protein PIB30_027210 [Stylosanthes scabra]|uniref:Pectinesterase inhibitor domain-containing protein n=1 Tax=Stylosanthes scabra TaxID=79078 RepID=A0ABU6TCI0_9FABA|nr:hypothetical protein [Stylosanthes scabra]